MSGNQITAGTATAGGGLQVNTNLTLLRSTVSGNQIVSGTSFGTGGGGISTVNATITNSTVSGNRVAGNLGGTGAGLWVAGTATLTNCTVAFNVSDGVFGGAGIHIFNDFYHVNIGNTVVARNTLTGSTFSADVYGANFHSQGHNLVGNAGTAQAFNGIGDQVGTSAAPVEPRLAALGNYGGTTRTHALLPGSPAVNAGASTGAPAADQRGVGRVGAVDIGAFESRGFSVAATAGTPQSAAINTTFGTALAATVTSAFGEPTAGGVVTFSAPGSGRRGRSRLRRPSASTPAASRPPPRSRPTGRPAATT